MTNTKVNEGHLTPVPFIKQELKKYRSIFPMINIHFYSMFLGISTMIGLSF